ncbi:MAG: adenylyl-sulfate kinase [Flavobacterium sp.]
MIKNIYIQEYEVNKEKQNKQKGHNSFLIWFTGLSGSGKSTIANKLVNALFEKGIHVYSLDGDNLRLGLNKDLSFSEEDRSENIRRIAEVSKLMIDAGIVTVAAFISPLEKNRQLVKEIVGKQNYVEIYIETPLEECERRDVKGLYAKARKGEIKDFTGISSPYEIPKNPTLKINTLNSSIDEAVEQILNLLLNQFKLTK